jgi:hypothetical protein
MRIGEEAQEVLWRGDRQLTSCTRLEEISGVEAR